MFGERECHPMSKKANPAALLPILVFLVLYLGLGLVFEYVLKIPMGFYSIPIVVIFLIALLVACCQNRALSFDEKLTLMGHGVGDKNIITMLLIFLAAGMFVGVVGRSSAESVAYFMLSIIPSKFAVAVLFVVSCFVSTAMGTSVGTITLIVPIAIPIAAASGYSLPLCIASVMGGAMFGDNLSFISDTTIAACNGQGCAMKDKFRENFHIAFPAALASLALILMLTLNADVHPAPIPTYNLIQIIPYVLVLIGGIIGINVFVVLLIGIVSGAVIALATGATGQTGILAVKALLENMGSGAAGMFETSMVAILVSAICALIREYGGFEALLGWIKKAFRGKRGGPDRHGPSRRRDGHCHREQHRRHRYGEPHRQGNERGIRHHTAQGRIDPRHVLLHLPGHHPLRRTDARRDLRGARAGLRHLRVRHHPKPLLPLSSGGELILLHCDRQQKEGVTDG